MNVMANSPEMLRPNHRTPPQTSEVAPADDVRTIMLNQVDWGAVFAGAAIALVMQIILLKRSWPPPPRPVILLWPCTGFEACRRGDLHPAVQRLGTTGLDASQKTNWKQIGKGVLAERCRV
jgi:hypothetical protein